MDDSMQSTKPMLTPGLDKDLVILFSESVIGIHKKANNKTEEYALISLTFPPKVEKLNTGEIRFKNNLENNGDFQHAMDLYFSNVSKWRNVSIAIGYDDDDAGHFMSECLRDNLIRKNVDPSQIFRLPLTEAGYILVQSFADTGTLKKYLLAEQEFSSTARRNKIRKNVGFPKVISLKYVVRSRNLKLTVNKDQPGVNPDGTSTVTVVTQFMIGD